LDVIAEHAKAPDMEQMTTADDLIAAKKNLVELFTKSVHHQHTAWPS
jgi:hypothetical protein